MLAWARRAWRESDGGREFGLPRVALCESGNPGLCSATTFGVGEAALVGNELALVRERGGADLKFQI
jgi:hypothetical protein